MGKSIWPLSNLPVFSFRVELEAGTSGAPGGAETSCLL